MGIDGIGKPGAPPPGGLGSVDSLGKGGPVGDPAPFKVDRSGPAAATEGSDALARLKQGEISLDEYLEHRVEDAVGHLSQKLPAEQLAFVKETLREQLRIDPVLVELVRRTTA